MGRAACLPAGREMEARSAKGIFLGFSILFACLMSSPLFAFEYVSGEVLVEFKPNAITSHHDGVSTASFSVNSSASKGIMDRHGLLDIDNVFHSSRKFSAKNRVTDQVNLPDHLSNTYKLTFSNEADIFQVISELQQTGDVAYAEPNYIYKTCASPNDTYYDDLPADPNQWGLFKVHLTPTGSDTSGWDLCKGASETVIAIVDTGVEWDHPDLAANIWANSGEIPDNHIDDDGNGYIDDVRGWDFVDADNDPMDINGHGTHCSGIASAVTDNGIGIAGAGWTCRIMAARAGDSDGSFADADIVAALEYAADNGADVISMSFGGPTNSMTMSNAIDYAYSKGCFLVAAAGNKNTSAYSYPAAQSDVMAVAASTTNDYKTSYSNFGDWVDIAAPGGDNTDQKNDIYSTYIGPSYEFLAGTSMATPLVAGIAGLVRAKHPDWTNSMVFHALQATADPVLDPVYKSVMGAGRVNAYRALAYNTYADISFPAPSSAVYDTVVNIIGSASWEGSGHYTVSTAEGRVSSEAGFIDINYSTSRVSSGILAVWDNEGLSGPYTIRLMVNDQSSIEARIVVYLGGSRNRVKIVGKPLGGPNPFNPNVNDKFVIHYKLSSDADIRLIIYSLTGRMLLEKRYSAGESGGKRGDNLVEWDGKDHLSRYLANGAYLYQIVSNGMVIGDGKIAVYR
jgi:thermitase